MGGRISEGPSSSVEEHDDRQSIGNFRGSDKMLINEALGADRGHNCLSKRRGFARRFCLHCDQGSARGAYGKLTDLRVTDRYPVNEFLGRGLKRRTICLPGDVRLGLSHLAFHFRSAQDSPCTSRRPFPKSIVVNSYGFLALSAAGYLYNFVAIPSRLPRCT
jgi:hypothetical protein